MTRNYSEASAGRWLSSGLAVFLACAQLCFGEVAWFLFLAILRRAMSDAPAFLDRGTFVRLFLILFYFRNTHHWAIQLTSCFLITGKLRRVELLGVFRRCSGEFLILFPYG